MEKQRIHRNSSIELLKIIAIIIIIFSHSIPDGNTSVNNGAIDIATVTSNFQLIIAGYLKNLGQIGNDIFLICSAWFLVDSNKIKPSKIMKMIGDCFVISVGMLVLFTLLGYEFRPLYIIQQFFPITFRNCWFLTCYLLLYAIHPILNIIIKSVKKETLLCINITFFILYNCLGFIMKNSLFYFSNLIGFIGLYLLVAYMKMYLSETSSNKKLNIILFVLGITGWILSSCLTTFLGFNLGIFSLQMQRWNTFMNPCFILIAISLFNIFRRREFHNLHINYISSLSLLIYMIHTNRIIRDYVRFQLFEYIKDTYGFDYLVQWVLLFAIINLVLGLIAAVAYNKLIQKYVHKVFGKIENIIARIYGRVSLKILSLK